MKQHNQLVKFLFQNISSLDVGVMKATSLQVAKVNSLALEDFVTVNDDVTLSGLIKFEDSITAISVELVEGSNFDLFAGYGVSII